MRHCLISFLFLLSCQHRHQVNSLPVLTVNDRPRNAKIVGRIPDYGDGHADGCIVMNEMRVGLKIGNKEKLTGKVSDVVSCMPLPCATIVLTTTNTAIQCSTDEKGEFVVDVTGLSSIKVTYIGYRQFTAKL